MAPLPGHDRRCGPARRRHPHPGRHRHDRDRGPAHGRLHLSHHRRQPAHRRGDHHCHPLRALCYPARGHLLDRQALRPGHDSVVRLPGGHGRDEHRRDRQLGHPARVQPGARSRVPLLRHQCRGPHGPGQRLPLHHWRGGPLFRHGACGQGQRLCLLALRQGGPHPQLPGPGRLHPRPCERRRNARDDRPQPLLRDGPGAAARLRRAAVHLRRHHRVAGADHRLLLHRLRGDPPGPHAAHEDRLPLADKGPALHSASCSSRPPRTWRRPTVWPSRRPC